ncbi:MAG: PcfK-like family protein [Bacteroidales bacterium]|nr:PcfK-like family protein [Bacteroidales bacterium]
MTLEDARDKGISIFDTVPDGWRKIEGATTALEGYDWYSNNVSRYSGNYETALVRRRNMNEELREQAIAKLEAEREAAQKDHFEPVIDYLIGRCRESDSMTQDIMQEHKTWGKCMKYIMDTARTYLNSKPGGVLDETVYEWAEDYFHLDDKAAEAKKAKQAEKQKKENEKRKKESEERRAQADAEKEKKKEEAAAKKAEEKAKRKEVEGQMDLFSMFGEEDG